MYEDQNFIWFSLQIKESDSGEGGNVKEGGLGGGGGDLEQLCEREKTQDWCEIFSSITQKNMIGCSSQTKRN